MSALHFDFVWYRDSAGYDIVDGVWPISARSARRTPADELGIVLPEKTATSSATGRRCCIVRRGGELESYRPLEKFEHLYEQFARDVTSPEALLRFIKRFGPLSRYGLDRQFGENVEFTLQNVKAMKMVLMGGRSGIREVIGSTGMPLGDMAVKLIADPAKESASFTIHLGLRDLISGLWVQLGQSLSAGTAMRQCALCQSLFAVGPDTGRRRDARFCSDDHRVSFNSRRRSQKEE